jgi:hypothetical protein
MDYQAAAGTPERGECWGDKIALFDCRKIYLRCFKNY